MIKKDRSNIKAIRSFKQKFVHFCILLLTHIGSINGCIEKQNFPLLF